MYSNKLLNIYPKTIVFLFFLVASNSYGMNLCNDLQDQKQIITFRSLEKIPCWSLNRIAKSWKEMPEDTKEKIRKQVVKSNDEKFLTLFNVAVRLPFDLQNLIAAQLYKGHGGAIKKFFKAPMVDIINEYAWSHKVFHKGEYRIFRKMCKKSSNWDLETIFQQSKNIVILESCNRGNECHDYNALKSIAKVYNKFQDTLVRNHNYDRVKYKYRDLYTLTNFMKYQSLEQWYLLPLILTPFLSTLICRFIKKQIESVEDIINKNKKREILNLFIQNNFEKTRDTEWLSLIQETPNPYEFTDKELLVHMIGLVSNSIPLNVAYWTVVHKIIEDIICSIVPNKLIGLIAPTILWGCFMVLFTFFYIEISDFIASENNYIEQPVLGLIGVVGCYAATCSISNIIKMRSVKKDEVAIAEIPQLLKRTDIEIV